MHSKDSLFGFEQAYSGSPFTYTGVFPWPQPEKAFLEQGQSPVGNLRPKDHLFNRRTGLNEEGDILLTKEKNLKDRQSFYTQAVCRDLLRPSGSKFILAFSYGGRLSIYHGFLTFWSIRKREINKYFQYTYLSIEMLPNVNLRTENYVKQHFGRLHCL